MLDEFKASVVREDFQPSQSLWFIFSGYRLLIKTSGDTIAIPLAKAPEELGVAVTHPLFIGTMRGLPCYAATTDTSAAAPAGVSFEELRSLFARLDDRLYAAALTAVHLVEWDRNCQFCSKCRRGLKLRTDVRAKECEECGRLEFPRVSPAIIVLIEKGNTLLLARSARFPGAFFSVLAGFVEPGESLEAAVHREIMEETGIAVKDIRYFGSQPWPFPDSLMIGFIAQYESGEIQIDGEEIVEAGKLSIARQLIDWFIAKHS
jgi:NAD+ diphosphatase